MADDRDGPWSDAGDLSGLTDETAAHPFAVPESRRYALGAPLGAGGMGTVHRAVDGRLLREVALKAPATGPGAATTRTRLAQEAWVTAQLDHPGIVSVHDAGIDPDGRPFYVMRLIEGETLADLLAAPSLDARLDLLRHLRDVCEAVGYAHRRGFVHRDLKPANIMVGRFGETQVMDWGLARPAPGPTGARWRAALPDALAAETVAGVVVGTPAYLSPEQAEGEPATEASDVWSLGVLLHELLSGRRAFRGPSARDILVQVRQARLPPLPPDLPDTVAPLVSVLQRATAARPADRFPDAKALADELTRYLEGGRVSVHAYSPRELLGATVRAWRGPLVAGLVLAVAAGAGIGLSLHRAQAEADRATRAEAEARAAQAEADTALQQALIGQARTAAASGDRGRAQTLAAHALLLGEDPRARGILLDATPRPVHAGAAPLPACGQLDLDPRGRWLACQGDGQLSLWDLERGTQQWTRDVSTVSRPRVDTQGRVASTSRLTDHVLLDARGHMLTGIDGYGIPAWTDAGEALALVGTGLQAGPPPTLARVHDCPDGSADAFATTQDAIYGVCFGEVFAWTDGAIRTFPTAPLTEARGFPRAAAAGPGVLVWGSQTGTLVAHALPGGAPLWERSLPIGAVRDLVVSADGRHLAVLGTHLGVHLLDAATGQTVLAFPERPGQRAIAIDAEDRVVLLAEELHRWRVPAGAGAWRMAGGVTSLAFSPTGAELAVGHGRGASVLSWEAGTWRPLGPDFGGIIKSVDHSEAGLVVALPTEIVVVDDETGARTHRPTGARRMGTLADGLVIFASYGSAGPGLLRLDGSDARSIALPDHPVGDIEAAADGQDAVWATVDGIWEVTLPGLETRLVLPLADAAVAARSDTHVAGASRARLVVAPRAAGAEGGWSWQGVEHRILEIRFSADGTLLATGHADGTARIFDARTGTLRAELPAHSEQVPALAVHPSGRILVTGSWDRRVRPWVLDQLDTPAADLLAEVEAAWGLSRQHALR